MIPRGHGDLVRPVLEVLEGRLLLVADVPDLVCEVMSAPADSFTHGDVIEVVFKIEEMGGFNAGAFDWQVNLSNDRVYGDADDVPLAVFHEPGLTHNTFSFRAENFELPADLEPGDEWYFIPMIDSGHDVVERTETNNTWVWTAPFRVYPSVSMSLLDGQAAEEGPDGGAVRVHRTGGTATSLPVGIIRSGTAQSGQDYTAIAEHVTIPAGASYVDVAVAVIDDALSEVDETALLIIDPPGPYYVLPDDRATVTIFDNDPAFVSVADPAGAVLEGLPLSFNVTISPQRMGTVQVEYTLSSGTALPGSDYVFQSGTLNFVSGDTSETIVVQTLADGEVEGMQSFYVDLTGATGAEIDRARATGTILNNPMAVLSINDALQWEADSGSTPFRFCVP